MAEQYTATHPRLLKVSIKPFDDVVFLFCQPSTPFLARQSENSRVHLLPELNSASGDLVNGLAACKGRMGSVPTSRRQKVM